VLGLEFFKIIRHQKCRFPLVPPRIYMEKNRIGFRIVSIKTNNIENYYNYYLVVLLNHNHNIKIILHIKTIVGDF
jgi:hypothetical protein